MIDVKLPDLPGRIKVIRKILRYFHPDIVHMFTIPQFAYYPFLCSINNKCKCDWIIDIRSPPLQMNPLPNWLKPLKSLQTSIKQVGFTCVASHVKSSASAYFSCLYKPLYEVPLGVDIQHLPQKVLTPAVYQPVKRLLYLLKLRYKD